MEGNLASVTIYEGAFIKQQVSFPGGAEGAYINVTDYNEFGEAGTTYQVHNPGGFSLEKEMLPASLIESVLSSM
ncbi:MAG: hypothetical protein ABIH89_04765 [Elusimicrobiota bacterium]